LGLPFVLLLGFLLLPATLAYGAPLPGSATAGSLLWSTLLWPLPSLLVLSALRRQRRRLVSGARGGLHPRVLLRASAVASPAVLHVAALYGGWLDATWQLAGDSHLATFALLSVPLATIELPRLVLATVAETWLEGDGDGAVSGGTVTAADLPGIAELWPVVRLRLGWPLLLPMPCLLLGAGLDVLQLDRGLHCFFLGTSIGVTAGMLVLLVAFGLALPVWFRRAFGAVPTLPEPVAAGLRQTAARLGFPPSRVLLLPTGGRSMNAMMVGPLPFGRILCLTDGLLRTLDPDLLTGVVAHEVGHARMGHPGILLVLTAVVPLLLTSPLLALDPAAAALSWQALGAVLVIGCTWSIVRALARRFEHEADVASVQALGAGPCARALQAVAQAAMPMRPSWFGRLTSLHPDERVRCAVMLRYEHEPEFRARFDARGRRLRLLIAASLGLATAAAAATWWLEWPHERVLWRLAAGDVVEARAFDAAIGEDVPARWRETWQELRAELAAAAEVAPAARDWREAAPRFAEGGWRRGVEVIVADGPAAARPYFALAAAGGGDRVMRALLYAYCRAAADGDGRRMTEAREIVRRRGVPAGLEAMFAP